MTNSSVNAVAPVAQGGNELATMAANSAGVTMSSKKIALITGKEHKHILRDIRALIDSPKLDHEQKQGFIEVKDEARPAYTSHFDLDFKATMLLVTGYDAAKRAAVIDRWYDLEQGKATPIAASEVTLTLNQARFDEMNDAIISLAKSMTRLTGVVAHVIEKQDKQTVLPATSADKWVDPRHDFTISELADMLNCQPWHLRQRLIKDKAITSQGERAWKPVPAMIAKGYCEDVAKIGWKFTRKGAQAIIKHYTKTLA